MPTLDDLKNAATNAYFAYISGVGKVSTDRQNELKINWQNANKALFDQLASVSLSTD